MLDIFPKYMVVLLVSGTTFAIDVVIGIWAGEVNCKIGVCRDQTSGQYIWQEEAGQVVCG